ncbi:hypothetical protein PGQ11_009722 [Apiospora arundinis]|uniref:Cyanovirin-N domain-containing protein n=1 Tax=Apiospora arundinis TaxID=335852 RepID=A0ABR2I8A9_9PEZI
MLVNGSLSLGATFSTGHDVPALLLSTVPSLYTNITEPPSSLSSLASTPTVYLELSHSGCSVDGRGDLSNGPLDCSDKCRNQTALFTDAYTLYNCAVLSAAALMVQDGSLALDVANLTEADNLLHFGSLQTFD